MARKPPRLRPSLCLKIEAELSSETLMNFSRTIERPIPEDIYKEEYSLSNLS
jgi:hypothetical protein